jgi:hypothetical protein
MESFQKLKQYFNANSKLEKGFAKTAAKILNSKTIYKEKCILCSFAMNWIRYGGFNAKYSLFSNE